KAGRRSMDVRLRRAFGLDAVRYPVARPVVPSTGVRWTASRPRVEWGQVDRSTAGKVRDVTSMVARGPTWREKDGSSKATVLRKVVRRRHDSFLRRRGPRRLVLLLRRVRVRSSRR
ncbi:MAG: hypothetical protein AAF961_18975, partial [Planctomycetota bacterium]